MQNKISSQHYEVIIIGAGAAGLMCAIEAGKRGRKVLIIDHAKKPGEKIRISGGGRCNFTNINTNPENFLSKNPHFCISALKKYTANDFIKLVEKHKISYHEKTLGQLFCNGSSQEIINMLLQECAKGEVKIELGVKIIDLFKADDLFIINTENDRLSCNSLVIATGGPSVPKMGGSSFGYEIAQKFQLKIVTPRPALVPFTLDNKILTCFSSLSGISLNVITACNKMQFNEGMLFTHRGLSGPSILQISSYWQDGDLVNINLAPNVDIYEELKNKKLTNPKSEVNQSLTDFLPKRLLQTICDYNGLQGQLANLTNAKLRTLADFIQNWTVIPSGTEGYRTAEVTLGGVSTDELSSISFESKAIKRLYFIGEVIDVTGHLGGYNFQWAWSSGFVAGLHV